MSKVFEALRVAQQAKSPANVDRRRGRRLSMCVPVFVYGHRPGREPFHEEACLHHVSAEGGLLLLSTGVRHGQKLLLTSGLLKKPQKCFVVHARFRKPQRIEVGVEFAQPCPELVQPDPSKKQAARRES